MFEMSRGTDEGTTGKEPNSFIHIICMVRVCTQKYKTLNCEEESA
jgi:hypothetical protein